MDHFKQTCGHSEQMKHSSVSVPWGGREFFMKIDKKTLNGFLNLSDEKLLSVLRLLTGGSVSFKEPDAATMRGIRHMLSQITDSDLDRASYLMDLYKRGKKMR